MLIKYYHHGLHLWQEIRCGENNENSNSFYSVKHTFVIVYCRPNIIPIVAIIITITILIIMNVTIIIIIINIATTASFAIKQSHPLESVPVHAAADCVPDQIFPFVLLGPVPPYGRRT